MFVIIRLYILLCLFITASVIAFADASVLSVEKANKLLRQGVDCYKHKQYDQAELLFNALADQHDRRAVAWIKKIERQRQAHLQTQRESIRKQFIKGVQDMYQEALSLYKQGDYATAADRFKDVQDIFPGFKNSKHYMDEARQKSLKTQAVISPTKSKANVSKALDLFDPNAP